MRFSIPATPWKAQTLKQPKVFYTSTLIGQNKNPSYMTEDAGSLLEGPTVVSRYYDKEAKTFCSLAAVSKAGCQ